MNPPRFLYVGQYSILQSSIFGQGGWSVWPVSSKSLERKNCKHWAIRAPYSQINIRMCFIGPSMNWFSGKMSKLRCFPDILLSQHVFNGQIWFLKYLRILFVYSSTKFTSSFGVSRVLSNHFPGCVFEDFFFGSECVNISLQYSTSLDTFFKTARVSTRCDLACCMPMV